MWQDWAAHLCMLHFTTGAPYTTTIPRNNFQWMTYSPSERRCLGRGEFVLLYAQGIGISLKVIEESIPSSKCEFRSLPHEAQRSMSQFMIPSSLHLAWKTGPRVSAEPHDSVPWETQSSVIWLCLESQWDFLSICSLSLSYTHVVFSSPAVINISLS